MIRVLTPSEGRLNGHTLVECCDSRGRNFLVRLGHRTTSKIAEQVASNADWWTGHDIELAYNEVGPDGTPINPKIMSF